MARPPCPECKTKMIVLSEEPEPQDGIVWKQYVCPKREDSRHQDHNAVHEYQGVLKGGTP